MPTRFIALIHWVFCVHCIVDSVLGEEISLANNIGRMFGLVCLGSYLARFLLAIYGEEKESASIQNLVRFCQSCLKYLQFFVGREHDPLCTS